MACAIATALLESVSVRIRHDLPEQERHGTVIWVSWRAVWIQGYVYMTGWSGWEPKNSRLSLEPPSIQLVWKKKLILSEKLALEECSLRSKEVKSKVVNKKWGPLRWRIVKPRALPEIQENTAGRKPLLYYNST